MPSPIEQRPLIRAWETGGDWSVTYQPPEMDSLPARRFEGRGRPPAQVVRAIMNFRKANGLPPDSRRIWRVCNIVWGRRFRHRWLGDPAELKKPGFNGELVEIAGTDRKVLQPMDYGAWIWQYFNTFGLFFDPLLLTAAIEHTKRLLDPKEDNMGCGCPTCHAHFLDSLVRYPPARVQTRKLARAWIWKVHDRANKESGARRFSYNEVARIYGWPQITTDQLAELIQQLEDG